MIVTLNYKSRNEKKSEDYKNCWAKKKYDAYQQRQNKG